MKNRIDILLSVLGILIIGSALFLNSNTNLDYENNIDNQENNVNKENKVEENSEEEEVLDRDKTIVTHSSSGKVYEWARQQPYYLYETQEGEIVKKVNDPFWESNVININENTTLEEISKEEFDLYAFDLNVATEYPFSPNNNIEELPDTIEKYTKVFDKSLLDEMELLTAPSVEKFNVYKFRKDMDIDSDFSEFELSDYYNGGLDSGIYKYIYYSPVYDKYIFWKSGYEGGFLIGVNAKNPDYPIQKLPGDAIKSPAGDKYFVVGSLHSWMGVDDTGFLYVFTINEKGELIYDSGLKGFENFRPYGGTDYFGHAREASWLEDGSGIVWRTFDHCSERGDIDYGDDCKPRPIKYFLLKFN